MLVMTGIAATAQTQYTREFTDMKFMTKAQQWMDRGAWRNGLKGVSPHQTVNAGEFWFQYHKNPQQWKTLFRWLAKTDLLALPAGKHNIEGSTLVASVEDSKNEALESRLCEMHREHIDFQFVVRGTERFGLVDHLSSRGAKDAYKPDVQHYWYDLSRARFYDSNPNQFFLFFPDDWHIAKVATENADQNIRVIVVKLDYVR
jgi:YhcH/YjgK/YiaL family protein